MQKVTTWIQKECWSRATLKQTVKTKLQWALPVLTFNINGEAIAVSKVCDKLKKTRSCRHTHNILTFKIVKVLPNPYSLINFFSVSKDEGLHVD